MPARLHVRAGTVRGDAVWLLGICRAGSRRVTPQFDCGTSRILQPAVPRTRVGKRCGDRHCAGACYLS